MFTYNELSKDSNTATISLDGSYSDDIYVPAKNYDRDVSEFELQEVEQWFHLKMYANKIN